MPEKDREGIRARWPWVLIALVFAADQLSKWWVWSAMDLGESYPLLEGLLHITLVMNTGAAFGILRQYPGVLTALTAVVSIVLAVFLGVRSRGMPGPEKLAFSLILAGALGNLIDRLRIGAVIDMIDLRFWPVFNIADSAITCGGVLLALLFLRSFLSGRDGG